MNNKKFFQIRKTKIKWIISRFKARKIDSTIVNTDYLDKERYSKLTNDDTFFGLLRKAHTSVS